MKKRRDSGIALFMVISSIALLSVLMSELTYSTQINSRLAYNYIDNLKAYYLAKSALKLALVRIRAYTLVKNFTNDPNNKLIKEALGKGIAEKIWSTPFAYPVPVLGEMDMQQANTVKEFNKQSSLSGSFEMLISSESSKLNLNNLLVKQTTPDESPNPTPSPAATKSTGGTQPTPAATPTAVEFRPMLESSINAILENKKTEDREFSEVYRNIFAKDVVDAIVAYLIADSPPSNLPGFRPIVAKSAPFYSITELHMVPGIDDELFNLLSSVLTVYATPGINVNTIDKRALISLIPELGDKNGEAAIEVLRVRDDKDVGVPWTTEDDFWKSVTEKGGIRNVEEVKARLSKSNTKLIFEEGAFRVAINAKVGLATKKLDAFVVVDPKAAAQKSDPSIAAQQSPTDAQSRAKSAAPGLADPNNPQQGASSKKASALNLIYWRML